MDLLPPSLSFSLFTLIGASFFTFELFFLMLYSTDFWFGWNISWLGIPAILLALGLGHLLLTFNESPLGCKLFYPFKKGSPVFVYKRWLKLDESGITFGNRHLLWSAIDEVNLNFWGTLIVKSRSLCGADSPNPDVVLKFPFSAGAIASQQKFMAKLKQEHPQVKVNTHLEKRLIAKKITGANLVQILGVIFMMIVLFDVGQSTFRYLEMMKEYYLSETYARDGKLDQAETHFHSAEQIREHPFPFSWVTTKLLSQGKGAAGVFEIRSNAQWYMGQKNDAIESLKQAIKYDPKTNRLHLCLARYLSIIDQYQESLTQIQSAIDNHTNSLLPRLYMVSSLVSHHDSTAANKFYDSSLDNLRDSVFSKEPLWPPGGNRFLHEMFYQDDITFMMDKLLDHQYKPLKETPSK